MSFVEQDINFDKNETKSKTENPTQFQRDEPCASAHVKIAD